MAKIILDLCGGTGSWSKPYKEAGHDVRVITLPAFDVTRWRFIPEIMEPLRAGKVYGILAAPPCTMFSLARQTAKLPRDYRQAMLVVKSCLNVIWEAQYTQELGFWALENPVGHLRKFLGRPRYTFEQWEFGDTGVKPTDIWGYFNEPKKTVKTRPANLTKRFPNGRSNAIGWSKSAELRAITPAGFAKAFYEANK